MRTCEWLSHSLMPRFKRGIQYAAACPLKHCCLWNTGSPAFAGDDSGGGAATTPSLERHVLALGDVGAEARGDGDAAAQLLLGGVGDPDRIAAAAEERVGVRRLGLGRVKLIGRIVFEDALLLRAAAVGLDVQNLLVVARQRQRDLAAEILRGLGVEQIRVGPAGRGVELARSKPPAAGDSLVVA